MDQIHKYYVRALKIIASLSALFVLMYDGISLIIYDISIPLGISIIILDGLMKDKSFLWCGVVFVLLEFFYRKYLWRIATPGLDFNGTWKATTFYDAAELLQPGQLLPTPQVHRAKIQQDALSIRISHTADSFASWGSKSMNIVDRKIMYSYEVNYKNTPSVVEIIGYEEMSIVETKGFLLLFDRPQRLAGTFYHCAMGLNRPLYRGRAEFVRE